MNFNTFGSTGGLQGGGLGQSKLGGFGAKPGGFGSAGLSSPGGFGASTNAKMSPNSFSGIGGGFGQSQPGGLAAPQQSAFAVGGLGGLGGNTGLGAGGGLKINAGPTFGSQVGSTGFGSTMGGTGLGGTGFGAATNLGFGANAAPANTLGGGFGANTGATPFGGFGAATTGAPAFGASQSTGFGGGLGGTSTPAFGSTSTGLGGAGVGMGGGLGGGFGGGLGGFGGLGNSASIGGANVGGFGAAAAPQMSMFGGNTAGNNMGLGGGLGGGLGNLGGSLGGGLGGGLGAPATSFGGIGGMGQAGMNQNIGTGNPKFQPTQSADKTAPNGMLNLQCISCMPAYESKSLEELRFEDYKKKQQGGGFGVGQPQQAGGFGFGFGAAAPAPAAGLGGLGFGANSSTTNPNMFGFGSPAAGAAAQATGGFNFGAPAQQTAPAFQLNNFGAQGFGSPGGVGAAGASAFSFGKPAASPAPAAGAFAFGQPAAAAPAANNFTATGFNFGAGIGAPAASSAAPQFGGGAFNFAKSPTVAAPALGAPSAFGFGFGATPAPAPAAAFPAFGAQPAAAPAFGFAQSAATNLPAAAPLQMSLENKLDLLRKKDELEIRLKDDKLVDSIKRAQGSKTNDSRTGDTSTSVQPIDSGARFRGTIRTKAKIVPKGFVGSSVDNGSVSFPTSQSLSSTTAKELGATTSFIKPNDLLNRKSKRLVIADVTESRGPSEFSTFEDSFAGVERTPLMLLPPPPPQSGISANEPSSSSKPMDSSFRMDLDTSIAVSATPDVHRLRRDHNVGDPTGLTPAHTESPFDVYHSRSMTQSTEKAINIGDKPEDLDSPAVSMSSRRTPGSINLKVNDSIDNDLRINNKSRLLATPLRDEVPYKPNNPPSLTQEGYYTKPCSIDAFRVMSDDELSRVQGFCVGRMGYGEIEWLGSTDIRGLNLDDIVLIEKKSVLVYHNSDKVIKPAEGFGLNKPAIITLNKVLPKEGTSTIKQLQFESKLREVCANDGSEFLDYNQVTGVWIFKVFHFSRYGLADSDDEDEGVTAIAAKSAVTTTGRSAEKVPIAARRGVQFTTASPMQLKQIRTLRIKGSEVASFSAPAFAEKAIDRQEKAMDIVLLHEPIQKPFDRSIPLQLPQSVFNSFTRRNASMAKTAEGTDIVPDNSPCLQLLSKARREHLRSLGIRENNVVHTKAGVSSSSNSIKKPVDFGLAMGRSFRVGWGPSGELVYSGGLSIGTAASPNSARITVAKLQTNSSNDVDAVKSNFTEALAIVHKNSKHESSSPDSSETLSAGRWMIPSNDPSSNDEYSRFLSVLYECKELFESFKAESFSVEWVGLQAVLLVLAAFGQEKGYLEEDTMPQLEYRDAETYLCERRHEALSLWLKDICCTKVSKYHKADDGSYGQQSETYSRIFALLSCNRVSDAVSVAENAGLFRLAMILSQTSDGEEEIGTLLQKQLIQWNDMGACDPSLFPPELLDIYRLLSALPTRATVLNQDQVISFDSSILSSMGWYRGVGMFMWYCRCDYCGDDVTPISGALLQYDNAVSKGDADRAFPSYVYTSDYETRPNLNLEAIRADDSLYSLFRLLFIDMSSPIEVEYLLRLHAALRSEGTTGDSLDYRAAYLKMLLLHACMFTLPDNFPTTVAFSIVRSHFISQLLVNGEWKWALFVALLVDDEHQRNHLVRDIVLRYAGQSVEDHTVDFSAEEWFVMKELKVPAQWLHEAVGYRFGCKFNRFQQIRHLQMAGELALCNSLLVYEVAPAVILQSRDSSVNLLQLFAASQIQNMDISLLKVSPYAQSRFVLEYLQFRSDLSQFMQSISASTVDNMTEQLMQLKHRARDLLHYIAQIYQICDANGNAARKDTALIDGFDAVIHETTSFLFSFCSDGAFNIDGSGVAQSRYQQQMLEVFQSVDQLIWNHSQILEAKKLKYLRRYCESYVLDQCSS